MGEKSDKYYEQFVYRIEKKITVEDFPKMKDYAKQGIYMYIIHDNIDNNRFLFLSSQHYEEETKIFPETFKISRIAGTNESIHLKIKFSRFGKPFFRIMNEGKGDFSIIFKDIIYGRSKENKLFKQFKTHTKKVALDNPDWYLEYILKGNCISHNKKVLRMILCQNKYNDEILDHAISTFFSLENYDFQKFNDHSIVLDGGKTGKSTLIGYMGEKLDNVSIAGLYGSSDSKRGKFKGGIVTTTKKTILIDELNELIKNGRGDKILSVLNSLLENGVYNYQKQFGQKIRASNQFFFMGNIGDELNFSLILLGTFGNVETVGRRIGIITYNNQLKGYEKGLIRPSRIDPYLNAISIFMSNIFNQILTHPKYVTKLYEHKHYQKLQKYYFETLTVIENEVESIEVKQFIRSHKETIDRIITRALKLWIFKNLDELIAGTRKFDNHTLFEVLKMSEIYIEKNIINLKNIKEHNNSFKITDKTPDFNKSEFDKLNKGNQKLLKFFWHNRGKIDMKGVDVETLDNRSEIKYTIKNMKIRGISNTYSTFFVRYGINMATSNNKIVCRILNMNTFKEKLEGIFEHPKSESKKTSETKTQKIENAWNKKNDSDEIEEIDMNMV